MKFCVVGRVTHDICARGARRKSSVCVIIHTHTREVAVHVIILLSFLFFLNSNKLIKKRKKHFLVN